MAWCSKLHKNSVAYATIILASSMMSSIFFFYYVNIFLNRYKIQESWFQITQVIFMIWNAVNDPLFGYWQDNFRGECFKTRTSAIKYGAFLWAVSFLLPWFPWTSDPANAFIIGLHLLVSLFMYDALLTSVLLAQCTIFTEVFKTTEDRVRIIRYTQVAQFVGRSSVFVCEYFSDNLKNYGTFQCITVVVAIAAWLLLRYAGNNLETTKTGPDNPGTGGISVGGYMTITWQIIRNWNFACCVTMNFMTVFHSTYLHNFARIVCNNLISDAQLSSTLRSLFYGSFMIMPQVTIFFGSTLVTKIGYYRIMQANFLIQACLGASVYWIGRDQTWALIVFLLLDTIIVAYCSALFNLAASDIIEEDAIIHKRSHTMSAMVYGTNALITKAANSLPAMVAVMVFNLNGYQLLRDGKLEAGPERDQLYDVMFQFTCAIPIFTGTCQFLIWLLYRIKDSHTKDAKHTETIA